MLNWRHERYVWLPYSGLVADSAFLRLSFDASALLSYIAKFADKEGVVKIDGGAEDSGFSGLTKLVAVELNERVAFRAVVLELVEKRAVAVATGTVTIENFKTWQTSPEPRRRLFRCEPSKFACLPAFARMYAAEFVRTADEDGFVGCTLAETLERRTRNKAQALRAKQRNQYVEKVNRRAEALAKDGFLLIESGRVSIKNYATAQMTRVEHAAASSSQSRSTPESPSKQHESTIEAPSLDVSARNQTIQSRLLVSSRDVPSPQTTEETPTVSLRSVEVVAPAPTQNDPTRVVPVVPPTAHTGGESRVVTLRLVPDAATPPVAPQRPTQPSMNPHPGASMQPSLFADPSQPTTAHAAPSEATDAPEPAPKPRSARKAPPSGEKAPKVKAPPKEKKVRGTPPAVTLACVQVLADAAGDRFAMGSKWSDGVWRNLARCALKFPDVAEWKLVGEMLAAHGDGHYDMIGVNRVTDGWFTGSLAIAEKWVANGRQSRRSGPFVAKTNATTIPEGHRKHAPSAAQLLANATGKAVGRGMPATFDEHDYDLSSYPDCPVSLAR